MPGERLTQQDRRHIAAGLRDGLTYAAIARRIGRPTSTVTREVTRNGGPRHYYADRAHRASKHPEPRQRTAPRPARGGVGFGGRDPRTVEQTAAQLTDLFVQTGLSQMVAKVLAALLTTDGGSLTSAELVRRLGVSPASISKAVGYLEGLEMIKRERDPRNRAERYVFDDDAWFRTVMANSRVDALIVTVSARGAQSLGAETPAGSRLDRLSQFLNHVNEDVARSAERWRHVLFPPEP